MELWTGCISFINTNTNWIYPCKLLLEYFSIFVIIIIYGFSLSPQKFEEGILEICFHLLRRANGNTVNGAKMSDPIQISRTISKIVSTVTV